jgi:hypothetical protein
MQCLLKMCRLLKRETSWEFAKQTDHAVAAGASVSDFKS